MNPTVHLKSRRKRRNGVLAIPLVAASLLASAVGAAPAGAQTQTGWIPLRCLLGGVVQVDLAATVTATFPDSVTPGQQFNLTGVTGQYVLPVAVQQAAESGLNADALEGFVTQLWTQTTNATTAFATTAGGNPVNANPNLFNSVGAVQPPNKPASNVRINGGDTTRAGFSDGTGQLNTPPETFSFGDIPIDPSMGTAAFGPAPGTGGGFASGAGTPDVLPNIGPITTTGAPGDNVVIAATNGPGGLAAVNTVVFHNQSSGAWGNDNSANCSIGGTATNPGPPFVNQFTIPIDGTGSASARGTDPDADLGSTTVAASFSAIVNCDKTQSTRPFIVRWTSGGTHTFVKSTVNTSRCTDPGPGFDNTSSGTATGTIDGSTPATLEWTFIDNSDNFVEITVTPNTGDPLTIIAAPPAALGASPGGVWTFPTSPWPAS